jgi:hypothetical protein
MAASTFHILPHRQRAKVEKADLLSPDAIAETYWHLAHQDRSAWTMELELRPFKERLKARYGNTEGRNKRCWSQIFMSWTAAQKDFSDHRSTRLVASLIED